MRAFVLLLILLLPTDAIAADWSHYANARFGYGIDIPPGFSGQGEADNGDGQRFRGPSGTALAVWGGNIVESNFEAHVAEAMASADADGWSLSYQASTPSWASYSGSRNGRILYAREIALCGGTQYAAFQLDYAEPELGAMDAVVGRLVRSLKATGTGVGC
jgi:hypothetical protein